jgi:ABC-type Fe3+/spermidine/putrescine transport system ATPase subunit
MSDTEPRAEKSVGTTAEQTEADTSSEETATRETVLDVSGLTKIYPDGTLAVDDIDFSVNAGNFCVIIGPSGCGKSTTLHSLVGKVEATEGTITLDGTEITETETYDRDIGLVFQDFQLFPHLTVEENVRYGLERLDLPADEADQRVSTIMETMQLSGATGRDPGELSAGQKQRVALARSLVLEPKLLLLDEPLGDMDYKLQKRMERELLEIHREFDTTFVYVTHDQTQAMRLADQIVVMNDGNVEQSDPVDAVYNTPETAFVATFVGDSNILRGTVGGTSEDGSVARVETDLGQFETRTDNLDAEPSEVVGTDLAFSIRPQHLTLGEDVRNTVRCRVEDVITRPGKGAQVVLSPLSAPTAELQLRSWEAVSAREGDEITVGWTPADAVMLDRTSVVEGIDLETDILGE